MSDTDKGLGAWLKSFFADPIQDPATGEGTVNTLLLGKFQRLQAFKDSDLPYDEEEYLRLKELLGKAGGGMMNMNEMIRPIGMAGGGDWKETLSSMIAKLDSEIVSLRLDQMLMGDDNEKAIQSKQNQLEYFKSLEK